MGISSGIIYCFFQNTQQSDTEGAVCVWEDPNNR